VGPVLVGSHFVGLEVIEQHWTVSHRTLERFQQMIIVQMGVILGENGKDGPTDRTDETRLLADRGGYGCDFW